MRRVLFRSFKEALGLENDYLYIQFLRRKLQERIQLNNFNISVALTEEFIGAVDRDDYFELRDPHTREVTQKVKARQLLDEIVDQAWKSGDPGIMFLDRINEYNPTPHIGEIEATNPCGEQPLLPYESCNLGSINLARFIKEGRVDFERLRGVVHNAVHFLDNVIDMNKYPLPEIERMTKGNRKVGLGVMGFGDMTTMLRIPYGSEKSLELAEEVMKFIRDEARKASTSLAEKRGVFPNWKGSIYDPESEHFKGEELRLRNATLTTIAPTGTISMIADCESGIEPPFSLAYTKTVMDGKVLHYKFRGLEHVLTQGRFDVDGIFTELEQGKRDKLELLPEDIRALAVTSMRLNPKQHIKVQAAFQKYTDNAVSKTINLPRKATREDIISAYLIAHQLGCKGITVYRDGSKDVQVLEEKVSQKHDYGSSRSKRLLAIAREERVGDRKRLFVITSYWESERNEREIERLERDGDATEFFIASNFFDPNTQALITALAIRGSKDLRFGVPKEEVIQDMKDLPPADEIGYDVGFGPGGEYTNRSIPDATWKAISGWKPPKRGGEKTGTTTQEVKEKKDNENNPNNYGFCNNCSRYGVISREGCIKCIHCGFSPKGCD